MVRQHHHRASNQSTHIKSGYVCIVADSGGKEKDMEREKIIKIKEEELDNQPMASQRAIEARDALDDALEEYIVAVQEDAFLLGIHDSYEAVQ